MKKALILLLLSFVLLSAVFALSSCGVLLKKVGLYDDFEYSVESGHEITLTGYKGDSAIIEIPSWIDGYKVTAIKFNEGDSSLDKIESIKIPKTIISITPEAFQPFKNLKEIKVSIDNPEYKYFHGVLYTKDGKNLICYPQGRDDENLTLHRRVTKIGERAFLGARNLKSITLVGTEQIGSGAFLGCNLLESVDFGTKIKSIGDGAFEGCSLISSVTIPDTVESIGAFAFKNCPLTSVSVSSNVSYVGAEAFGNSDGLTFANEYCGAYYLGNQNDPYVILLNTESKNETEYIVHPEVNAVYSSAFEGCENLASITLPNSLSCIGSRAFYGCKNLTSPHIPENVGVIEEYAFYGCVSITEIALPSSVVEIGNFAFAECSNLETAVLSERTQKIGEMAFEHCEALSAVEIPVSVSYIGKSAFANCSALLSVTFADADNWTTDDKAVEASILSNASSAAELLNNQDKAMIKLLPEE